MKPPSQRTLLWLAIILLAMAGMIMSPLASLLLAAFALLCTLPSILLGTRNQRLIAAVLMMGAIGMGVMQMGKGSLELRKYRKQAGTQLSPPRKNL